jgi:hypothetical protein
MGQQWSRISRTLQARRHVPFSLAICSFNLYIKSSKRYFLISERFVSLILLVSTAICGIIMAISSSFFRSSINPHIPSVESDQEISRPATPRALMGILLFAVCVMIFLPTISLCQDWVEGEVSGTWIEENNPFIIVGETFIPPDDTLIVQSGVEIFFDPGIDFLAHGTLILSGAEDNHISISTTDPEEGLGFLQMFAGGEEFIANWTDFNSVRIGSERINAHISNCTINTELERTNWGFNLAPELVEYENNVIGPRMILDGTGGVIQIHDNELTGVSIRYQAVTSMTIENNNLIGGSRIEIVVGGNITVENNQVEGEGGIGIQAFRVSQNLNVINNDLRYVIFRECNEIRIENCTREAGFDFLIADSESVNMTGNNFRIGGLDIQRVPVGLFEDNEFGAGGIDFLIPTLEMRNTDVSGGCTIRAEDVILDHCNLLHNAPSHRFEIVSLWVEDCEITNWVDWSINRFESIRNCVIGETNRLWEVEGFNPVNCEFGSLDLRNMTDMVFENCSVVENLSFYGGRRIEINTIEIGGTLMIDGTINIEITDAELNFLDPNINPSIGVTFNNCHVLRNFEFQSEDLTLNDVTIDGQFEIPVIQGLLISGGSFFRTEINSGGNVNIDGLTVRDYLLITDVEGLTMTNLEFATIGIGQTNDFDLTNSEGICFYITDSENINIDNTTLGGIYGPGVGPGLVNIENFTFRNGELGAGIIGPSNNVRFEDSIINSRLILNETLGSCFIENCLAFEDGITCENVSECSILGCEVNGEISFRNGENCEFEGNVIWEGLNLSNVGFGSFSKNIVLGTTSIILTSGEFTNNTFSKGNVVFHRMEENAEFINNLFIGSKGFATTVSSQDGTYPIHRYNTYIDFTDLYQGDELHETETVLETSPVRRVITNDLRLRHDSPCIDAGDPESSEDPDETRADIGALFYDQRLNHPPLITSEDLEYARNGVEFVFPVTTIDDDGDVVLSFEDLPEWLISHERDEVFYDTLYLAGEVPDELDVFDFRITASDGENEDTMTVQVNCMPYTPIEGEISGVLELDRSPFFVVNDIVVPEDDTLTIEPGVHILFHRPVREGEAANRIDVYGKLHATGTREDTIKFYSAEDEPGFRDYHGISLHIAEDDTTSFSYVFLDNSRRGLYSRGGSCKLSNCMLMNGSSFRGPGIAIIDSSIFANSSFTDFDSLVISGLENSKIYIQDCQGLIKDSEFTQVGLVNYNGVFEGNQVDSFGLGANYPYRLILQDNIFDGRVDISFRYDPEEFEESDTIFVCGNTFKENGYLLLERPYQTRVFNNYFLNCNEDPGLRITHPTTDIIISNNCFYDCEYAFWLYFTNPDFEIIYANNATVGCRVPINSTEVDDQATFFNNSFFDYNVLSEGLNDNFGEISMTNRNDDPCDMFGNIFLEPSFVNPDTSDFRLIHDSPLIDAGADFWVFEGWNDPDGSIADIGVLGGPYGLAYDYPVKVEEVDAAIVTEFEVHPLYPNPFNGSTTLTFQIPIPSQVKIIVYDLLGRSSRTIFSDYLQSGVYTQTIKMNNVPSGKYFVRVEAGEFVRVQEMTLLR